MNQNRKPAGLTGIAALMVFVACSAGPVDQDATADAADVRPGDTISDGISDSTGNEFTVCTPGAVQGCSTDGLGEVVCARDGSGWEVVSCGTGSTCVVAEGRCSDCIPGSLRCRDDDIVQRCNDSGTEWTDHLDCAGAETGKVCRLGVCIGLCELNTKLSSYIGCEYWAVDLDNAFVASNNESGYSDAAGAPWAIVISNTSTKYPARVEIDCKYGPVTRDHWGNPLDFSPIPPMNLRIFTIARKYVVEDPSSELFGQEISMDLDGTSNKPQAYRVKSSIPITAYQFNPLQNEDVFSNDASLLIPSNALGKYYVVMTREQTFDDLKGFLTVIATNSGETQVNVTVAGPTLGGSGIPAMGVGGSKTFILNQFDSLNIETNAYGSDLTGSIVLANHPVAVFGGSEAANAPNTNHCCPEGKCDYHQQWLECAGRDDCLCEWPAQNLNPPRDVPCNDNYDCISYNTCCADHLEMQMFPAKTWGTEYMATLSYPRGAERDVWRIMAAEDNTRLHTYPSKTNTWALNKGEFVEFDSSENFEIFGTKPLLVGQFLAAQQAPDPGSGDTDAKTGDPTFILAVPVEQFRTEYVFLAPDKYMFDCVNIIAKPGVPVFLDGVELKAEELTFRDIRTMQTEMRELGYEHPSELGLKFGDYRLVGQGNWAVWRLVVADGVHTAWSEEPFGVISYGYDQYVSYGYPAGLNLQDLKLINEDEQE